MPAARDAFVHLLSIDPDQTLDPFLVPPPIVDFFDKVRAEAEPELAPLRERKKQLKEQERLAEEARRRLLAEEQIRSGPPSKIILVQEHVYMLNFLPFGVGQFQNGDTTKGIIIAVSQVVLGAVNLGAILAHNAIADDPSRRCSGLHAHQLQQPAHPRLGPGAAAEHRHREVRLRRPVLGRLRLRRGRLARPLRPAHRDRDHPGKARP